VPFGAKAILVGSPEAAVVLVDEDGVAPLMEGTGTLTLKLIKQLSGDFVDKQELIEKVWGYRYDPLRHDSLVYGALSSLRRLLGERGTWLENSEKGWRFLPGLIWMDLRETAQEVRNEEAFANLVASPATDELSLRQQKAMAEIRRREQWVIRAYRSFFHVSTMTAFRDLDDLEKKGYLRRMGKGRATCYVLPKEST
jgi:DNA-binding winged helix-turn-helix (wHTH) protein